MIFFFITVSTEIEFVPNLIYGPIQSVFVTYKLN
jgi:hypothetical protein